MYLKLNLAFKMNLLNAYNNYSTFNFDNRPIQIYFEWLGSI